MSEAMREKVTGQVALVRSSERLVQRSTSFGQLSRAVHVKGRQNIFSGIVS